LNAFLDHDIAKTLKIQSVPVDAVVDYLLATHRYYIERMIPEVENRINSLVQHNDIDQQRFILVKNFFQEYKDELYTHVNHEEQTIYPYVVEVSKAHKVGVVSNELRKKMLDYPIDSYAEEHSDIESKLFDLKNILIKYLPESRDSYLRNQVLNALFKLENDLNDHSRIENMVLVPRIAQIEKQLLNDN
jgi:regulator of cell morphogenesis and NO signaling